MPTESAQAFREIDNKLSHRQFAQGGIGAGCAEYEFDVQLKGRLRLALEGVRILKNLS